MAVRVAFLGCGGIARAHMRCLAKVAGAQMVAFCDADETRAAGAAQEYGGKAYGDYERMLKTEGVDALWVCLPPFAHEGQEIPAAEKGIHLLVEKPVTLSLELAGKVTAAIERAGVISAVGYQIRYCPHVTEARQLLEGHQVDMVSGRYLCSMKGMKGWWPVMAQSGGQVVEQSTHTVDLMRYLGGEVAQVYARYALREVKDTPGWDVPDYGIVAMEFANGALGSLHTSAAYPRGWDSGVQVACDDMLLDCSFSGLRVMRGNETREISGAGDPMQLQDESFINAVATGKPEGIRSSYADGVKTLAVTLAANESAATGQPVKV